MPKMHPAWFDKATAILEQIPDVRIDHNSDFFSMKPRIAIRVTSLDGLGIIHQQPANAPFSLCVFEPSNREESGLAEVFERAMQSLEELPNQIAAWQKFRSATTLTTLSAVEKANAKIVQKTLREKLKLAAQFNTPITGSMEQRLALLGIDVDMESLGRDWPHETQSKLQEDMRSIIPERLAWHLPCDDTGRWFLKRRVPLFRYDRDKRRTLDACLTVVLPEKRSGRASLKTEWLNADSQSARLDATPEYFDERVANDFSKVILGSKRAATTKLQRSGKFAEACAIVGLELDDSIEECLATRRVTHMCTCCGELDEQLVAWSALLKQTLFEMNLATLVPLVVRDQAKRARPRTEAIPILAFPLQRHTRKAHLALDIRNPKKPRLTIETTGSMNRVPIPIWKRPIEIDALQRKMMDTANLPTIIGEQFT
jgi:hypothetical protein